MGLDMGGWKSKGVFGETTRLPLAKEKLGRRIIAKEQVVGSYLAVRHSYLTNRKRAKKKKESKSRERERERCWQESHHIAVSISLHLLHSSSNTKGGRFFMVPSHFKCTPPTCLWRERALRAAFYSSSLIIALFPPFSSLFFTL